ncbi:thioredoxin [Gemella sp. GH3]|uniref:thioredoxin n=1 Tax=unclassified Gemella TaxID=2624949 RepID=UPI0015D0CD61|nr:MULTISPECIES: thioredoxin [unclassified Gemella]MBF0713887.1 thioredoxin [Gemella sp. GH3.1]NYS50839.1 thioredoxin [Gemella sp. GH3]
MREITDKEFYELSKKSSVTLFDFWAPWCGPCKMLAPVLEELDGELQNIEFCKINVDSHQEAASEYGVMSIPTLLVMKDGEVLEELSGFRPKDALKEILIKYN